MVINVCIGPQDLWKEGDFRRLDEDLPPLAGMDEAPLSADMRRSNIRDTAEALNNALCLVEAVSVSPRYVYVICQRRRGLLRALGVLSAIKVSAMKVSL